MELNHHKVNQINIRVRMSLTAESECLSEMVWCLSAGKYFFENFFEERLHFFVKSVIVVIEQLEMRAFCRVRGKNHGVESVL